MHCKRLKTQFLIGLNEVKRRKKKKKKNKRKVFQEVCDEKRRFHAALELTVFFDIIKLEGLWVFKWKLSATRNYSTISSGTNTNRVS